LLIAAILHVRAEIVEWIHGGVSHREGEKQNWLGFSVPL